MKDINRVIELYNEINELRKNDGIIAFEDYAVHLKFSSFIDSFEDYSIIDRSIPEYPYELFTLVDGVKLFCIATQEQYESLTPIGDIIAEYETKLNELKKKKEVTAV